MRAWIEPKDTPVPPELLDLVDGNLIAGRALVRRGFAESASARAFLDPDFYQPAPPEQFPGMERAVERLQLAISKKEPILVWGDFDVDGQTATALLVDSLRELGGNVDYHIPVRAAESHGISLPVLERLLARPGKTFSLLLTCDTGIAAFPALEYAQKAGVDVIVTDHHELPASGNEAGSSLPPAYAVVTPRLLPEKHPLGGLPGVGVAYKLAEALYRDAGRAEGATRHLDLAALGIVADVANQTGDTRYLLQRGLERLRSTERVGLAAIFERANLNRDRISEEQIGFILAPRLNAIGRLADANPAVELLITADIARARILALEIEGLNSRRQLLTAQVLRAALAQLEAEPHLKDLDALVLSHPAWPAGVIGIVASRLVEWFGKPAILISSAPGEPARGSARSVAGVDITRAIAEQSDLLLGYGGHAMAAGFSIEAEHIPQFRSRLNRSVARQVAALSGDPSVLWIDEFLDWEHPDLHLASVLDRLAPFGSGNPAPVLATRGLKLVSAAALGRQKEHRQLTLENEQGFSRRVIWWNGGEIDSTDLLEQGTFDLAYTMRAQNYRGQPELWLIFEDYRLLERPLLSVSSAPMLEILDYRNQKDPFAIFEEIFDQFDFQEVQIWAEGESLSRMREKFKADKSELANSPMRSRDQLSACQTLVIWNAPPGRSELFEAIQTAKPRRLVLFGVDPGSGQTQAFLQRLTGLVKHMLKTGVGSSVITSLTAATAHSELAVRLGLEWLEAKGFIQLKWIDPIDDLSAPNGSQSVAVHLSRGGSEDPQKAEILLKQINELLDETRAYRSYFLRMDLQKENLS